MRRGLGILAVVLVTLGAIALVMQYPDVLTLFKTPEPVKPKIVVAPKSDSDGSGNVKDFMVPEYDENGLLKWRMFGNTARIELVGGKVEVQGMKLELFRNGQIDATLRSPNCLFDRTAKTANSEAPVEIVATNMLVTGMGFDWNANGNRMRIHNDVTVNIFNRKEMDMPLPGKKKQ